MLLHQHSACRMCLPGAKHQDLLSTECLLIRHAGAAAHSRRRAAAGPGRGSGAAAAATSSRHLAGRPAAGQFRSVDGSAFVLHFLEAGAARKSPFQEAPAMAVHARHRAAVPGASARCQQTMQAQRRAAEYRQPPCRPWVFLRL